MGIHVTIISIVDSVKITKLHKNIEKLRRNEEDTSLRISPNTHKDLVKIQGSIQIKTGQTTSLDVVLQELIKDYKKRHK